MAVVEERVEDADSAVGDSDEVVELDDQDELPLSALLSNGNGKDEAEALPAAKSRGRERNTPSPQPIAPTRRSSRRSFR